jgi:ABC-type Na+ transport system ATPase subunit NatA
MIRVERLTKRRGARAVVSDVTFRCEPGTVTGFLGPNGAGKSTTMRMLVGLSAPDSGEARILGGRYRDLPNPGRRVGVLLDASAQHAGRWGREALAVSAHTIGVPARRVDEVLELVGLDEAAARRRVGQYSLGMRRAPRPRARVARRPRGPHPRRARHWMCGVRGAMPPGRSTKRRTSDGSTRLQARAPAHHRPAGARAAAPDSVLE